MKSRYKIEKEAEKKLDRKITKLEEKLLDFEGKLIKEITLRPYLYNMDITDLEKMCEKYELTAHELQQLTGCQRENLHYYRDILEVVKYHNKILIEDYRSAYIPFKRHSILALYNSIAPYFYYCY